MQRRQPPRRARRAAQAPPPPAPAPPPPPPEPAMEQPQADWQDRRLGYDTFFPIAAYFRHELFTEYSLAQIERYSLQQLCLAPWPVYPRLVRLFYQNLRAEPDQPFYLWTYIDGHHIIITPEVIASAAALHAHRPADMLDPVIPAFHELATDICTRPVHRRQTHTLRRYIHHADFLLDTVIWRNIYPHGNKQERRIRQLAPLYCAHHGMWFDYGRLICQSFHYFWDGAHRAQKASSLRWLLSHAGLITAILSTQRDAYTQHPQYVISPDELVDLHREVYDPLTWTKTTAHFFEVSSSSEDRDDAADDEADDSDDAGDAPAPAPAYAAAEVPPGGFLMLPPPSQADIPSPRSVPPPPPSPAAPFQFTQDQYIALLQGQAQLQQGLSQLQQGQSQLRLGQIQLHQTLAEWSWLSRVTNLKPCKT